MTIYDIAELAGVSASSVSRVVNGKPGVSKKNREKIEALLKQYSYTPDANARSLVMQGTHTIGILTDDLASDRHKESISRVETELMRRGYYCIIKYLPNAEDSMESSMRELAGHRLEGVVCFGPSFRNNEKVRMTVKKYLPETPIMLVNHMGGVHLDNVYSVGANEKEGFTNCVRLLAARGCKNIALMLDINRVSAANIRAGFEHGIDTMPGVRGTVYMDVAATLDGGAEKIHQVLREQPSLDGLICANDLIAIGAMNELQDMGIDVPGKIAIIGEDNSLYCEVCRPRLSSLDTMLNSLTMMAVRTLRDVLEGRETSHAITLSCDIIERGTSRAPEM